MANDKAPRTEPQSTVSRRFFLRECGCTGAAVLLGAASAAHAQAGKSPLVPVALAPGRTPKEEADYQDMPKDNQRCSGCVLFIAPNACATVAGPISPDGWCKFFAAR